MPSYMQYKRQMAVLDADDSKIESWITVRGNHIPIKKGQSKEEAVKSFIESKGGSGKTELKSNKQVFYKNISGKQIGSPKGRTFIENEIMTEKEMVKRGFDPSDKRFERRELGKNDHHFFFGARFENKKENPDAKYAEYATKANEKEAMKQLSPDQREKVKLMQGLARGTISPDDFAKKSAKYITKESKYDPEFEVVRKNALANGNVYGGKYTQKSKAEAYKEYKNDTSSKENMKKANEFVNGTKNKLYGINNGKQVFSIKGGRVVVDPELKTANWYNSKGALTLKQKDLDTDAFIKHGVNELGWQKMSEKEESVLNEFQKIANKPEYKDKEVETGFEILPKDYTIAHKDKNGKKTVIAEVSHHNINQPVSVEETEEAVERFFEEEYTKNEAKALAREYKQYKTHIANLENLLKENRRQQQNTPYNSYTATKSLQLRREEERLIKQLHDAEKDFAEFKHYELS